jgi:dTDP-4-amino-4,6-dideoxygalactose transaminase
MMLNTSLAPWPRFSEEEIDAVSNVLRSGRVNYWTGEECRQFEAEYALWANTDHAIALANGTLALDLALKGIGIGPGDEVVVTPRTFIASISCVINAGATPIFADVDLDSGNIEARTIERVLTDKTRAIIPVHLAGWPCDMDAMVDLAHSRGIAVIEDCAQAHGSRSQGRPVGSIGDIGAWSFCQDKIITTGGEGGMVTVNDRNLWSDMWAFKDHGKSWDAVYERQHPPGFRWLHESFGTNWRMLEMQAVIGRIQLGRLAEWTEARTRNANRFAEVATRFPGALRTPMPRLGDVHAYYRFYTYVRPEGLRSGWSRDRILAEVNERGVPLFHGSCSEVYREKAFEGTSIAPPQRLPNALALGETSVMFLTHPTLTEEDVSKMCDAFETVMRAAAA